MSFKSFHPTYFPTCWDFGVENYGMVESLVSAMIVFPYTAIRYTCGRETHTRPILCLLLFHLQLFQRTQTEIRLPFVVFELWTSLEGQYRKLVSHKVLIWTLQVYEVVKQPWPVVNQRMGFKLVSFNIHFLNSIIKPHGKFSSSCSFLSSFD